MRTLPSMDLKTKLKTVIDNEKKITTKFKRVLAFDSLQIPSHKNTCNIYIIYEIYTILI